MWESRLRQLIEKRFSLILALGVFAGLFMPGLDRLPSYSPIILIALVMFFSCSKVAFSELQGLNKGVALLFFPVRFVLLPAFLYQLALWLTPQYAVGVLLIALMPVGVASTAIANLTGGNPSFSLSITVLTNALTPALVPLMLWALSGETIQLDTLSLLQTLALTVLVPSLLYGLVIRRHAKAKAWVRRESQAASTLLLGCMAASVIALQRSYIMANPEGVFYASIVVGLLYVLLYGFGFVYGWVTPGRDRLSYAICSGVNNIALSAGIAALYFSAETTVFTVIGEIMWVMAVAVFKRLVEFRRSRAGISRIGADNSNESKAASR